MPTGMFCLIAIGALALRAWAQTTASPYDLARAIDSHKVGWASISKALGVTDLPLLPRCDPSTTWPCSVDAVTVLKPSQVILALSGWPESTYLRFLEDGPRWRYTGSQVASRKNYDERYDALGMGTISFDAVKHLLLCRIEQRPARLNLENYPHLPLAQVATTAAADYLALLGAC